jgi:pimeloyl-ACP methyl ester carboxylesterase
MYSTFDLMATDGTRLTAWRNGTSDGPRVLVCNGMGVPPEAWPRLIADGCRYQVAGWNQRGVLGSDRPTDPSRVQIADHVADAVALLDALGWDDAIIVAWSLGVNVAFELANEFPDRVAGVFSVAGVPGGTFDTILAPQLVPRQLRRPLGLGLVHTGRAVGAQLNLLGRMIPKGRPLAELIRHSGVMFPIADIADVQPWVETFFAQDWDWYFTLALALERHGRIDPSFIEVPVTIVAGLWDALTSHDDVRAYAREIPHAEVQSLPGSHCLPLEYPDQLMDLLDGLEVRVQAHRAAQACLTRWTVLDEATPPEPVVDLREGGVHDSGESARQSLPWWASQAPPDPQEVPTRRRRSPRLAATGVRTRTASVRDTVPPGPRGTVKTHCPAGTVGVGA